MNRSTKIAFVSTMMPTPTNVGGPSALPYQLIAHHPEGVDVDLFVFNNNKIPTNDVVKYSCDLHSRVEIVKAASCYRLCNLPVLRWLLYRIKDLPFQTLISLPNKLISRINQNYDFVWLYPHYLLGIAKQMRIPMVITGPDSSALYYERCLKDPWAMRNIGNANISKMLKKQKYLESALSSLPYCRLHFVGEEDLHYYLCRHSHGDAFYLRHPSNMPENLNPKNYSKIGNKIKVVLTGKLDIYTNSDTSVILEELCNHASDLKDKYTFTFIGKGWQDVILHLKKTGYEVSSKSWVEDYFDELKRHDVQLFPISVGTGTKGKVLDALSAGIVCVGSYYAFENIRIEDGISGYKYSNARDIVNILLSIYESSSQLPDVARKGYQLVCEDHNPTVISRAFFEKLIV